MYCTMVLYSSENEERYKNARHTIQLAFIFIQKNTLQIQKKVLNALKSQLIQVTQCNEATKLAERSF